MLPGTLADFGLVHVPQWEQSAAELLLGQTEEKICLVLAKIGRPLEEPALSLLIECDSGIMSCRDLLGSNLTSHGVQFLKLQMIVAETAWNGRTPGKILFHKRPDNVALEALLVIDHVVRNTDLLSHAAGVVDVVERAAASLHRLGHTLATGESALVPKLHRQTDEAVTLCAQHGRDGGGVHTARHG